MDLLARQHASALEGLQRGIADMAVDAQFDSDPTMEARYGPGGRRIWRTEASARIAHLVQAIACNRPSIFALHVNGSADALRAREVPEHDIVEHLAALESTLATELPDDLAARAAPFMSAAHAVLKESHTPCTGLLEETHADATLARLYLLHLLQRDDQRAAALALESLRGGLKLTDVYERIVAPALQEIGRMWQLQEASIADEHFCTSATRSIIAQLRSAAQGRPADGRRALCLSVGGDRHDIGIRMVADALEMDGWKVEFLGADVPATEVVLTIEDAANDPSRAFHLVLAGAATPLSIRSVMDLVDSLQASADGKQVPLIVGGGCFAFDRHLATAIGATTSAASLTDAVDAAARLVPARVG